MTMATMVQQQQQQQQHRRRRQRQGKQRSRTARSILAVAAVAIMTVTALATTTATVSADSTGGAVRLERRRPQGQQSVRSRRPTTRGSGVQAGGNNNSNKNNNNNNNRHMQEMGGDGSFIQDNFFANRDPKDEDGSVAFFNNNKNGGGGGNRLQGDGGEFDGTVNRNNLGGLTGERFARNRSTGNGSGSLFRQGKGKKGKKKCKGRKGKKSSENPSATPSLSPSGSPSLSGAPSLTPSSAPSTEPSLSAEPSIMPSSAPSQEPSLSLTPSVLPSLTPSAAPSRSKKGKKGKKSSKKSDGKGKGKSDGKGKGGKGKGKSSWNGSDGDDWMWCDDDSDDIQDICQNCVCFNGICTCNCDQGIVGQLPPECQSTCVCPSGSTTCTCDCYDDDWNNGGNNGGSGNTGPSGSGGTWQSNQPAQSPSNGGSNSVGSGGPTVDYWPGQEYCNFMWQYNEGRGFDQSLVQSGDPTYTFGAGMEVQIDTSSRSSSDLEYVLNSAMRNPPALYTAYCEWEAERSFENAMLFLSTEGTRNLRELQDNGVVQVLMETWDDTGSDRCAGNQARQNVAGGGDCPWIMVTNVLNVWTQGNVDEDLLKDRLAFALNLYMGKLVTDMDWVTGVTEGPLVEETGGGTGSGVGGGSNAIEEMELSQSKSKAGPYIGAAAGTLAFILLLILLVRRRRNRADDEMSSHLKLDDDDDDTFFQDVGSEGSPNPEYLGREAHVVGEADSIYSHWTGYTGKKAGDVNADKGTTTDVHHCSSATCEICERRRQMGVDFVSARTASLTFPPTLPSDASRDYILEDTVEL